MVCQVRNSLKTGKLSKVKIEVVKRQIKELHVNSTKSETGELDTAEEEVVTQSDENVLLQKFTARVMDMLRTMVKWCN